MRGEKYHSEWKELDQNGFSSNGKKTSSNNKFTMSKSSLKSTRRLTSANVSNL